ncbi:MULTISPECIES: hypothetical protein [Pelosinus]|uniref:Uncharacterized protein n=1 Tax=Pelosinus fermentans B4 TaxID=1149862 RepID=I8RLN9_9FIRM|nr:MULTISPECIES: hypothetical protein [Pelosinus]EIW19565.1 hypothetical protein FB4_2748 [Pelosinus fermentans B4]EIW24702.1 hypothetical protein FA11_3093 [Pelosinus fermentans A11]OAM96018.1 hypothetical protein FR7_04040 [Pelosinus fermentans DSM 17108]SDR35420.1 hypothetical protein SAMN04515679_4207 [Pelosinus fermentans]
MRKKTTILVFVIVAIAFYCSYMAYSYDNRIVNNLSAYCNIDFRGVADSQTNTVTGATLSIVDFRYDSGPLEKFFIIDVDDKAYKIDSIEISAQPPTYSPKDFSTERCFKHTNTLFVTFPPQVLKEISQAAAVKVSFTYLGSNSAIELPLSAADLQYWKNQLQSF